MTSSAEPSLGGIEELEGSEGIDLDRLRQRAVELLQPPVVYLPIRHHSPTCAAYVRSIIEDLQPAAVLVEGPPSFDSHIDLLLDPAARMPLAIYSYASFGQPVVSAADAQENPGGPAPAESKTMGTSEPLRFSSYFPLCDYSPELVALRAGRSVGATLGFVDLDHHQHARFNSSAAGHADERKYEFSQTLQKVASELGCRDHNELWDHMVEGRAVERTEQVAAVLAYGTLARAGSKPRGIDGDGTAQREAAMARGIAKTRNDLDLAGQHGPIVVVTGAFHTVVLPELVAQVDPTSFAEGEPDPGHGDGGSLVDGVVTGPLLDRGQGLIRYSFDRLDALLGYAAGMPSPRWYQSVWEQMGVDAQTVKNGTENRSENRSENADDPPTPEDSNEPSRLLIQRVAVALRDHNGDGQPSVPSVVDAFVAAERLRLLRGRSAVTRYDALDAMVSCFTKGEDSATNPVRIQAAEQMTGFELGAVPPQTPRVQLAKDFDRLLIAHGLQAETAAPKQLNLDVYRSELARQRSRFLHGLVAIGVHFGRCITPLRYSRAGGRDVIRERWDLQLTGATDVSLTEAAIWGAGVEEAVAAKTAREFEELLATQPSSAQLMRMVMLAAQRGVPAVVTAALDELRRRVAVDPSLPEVVAALSEAELLWSAREPLGGSSLVALPELAAQLFVRACQLGDRLHEAGPDQQRPLVDSIEVLHRIVTTDVWPNLDFDLFWAMLAQQRKRVAPGMLRGAIGGLEWRGGRASDDELVTLTRGHIATGSDDSVASEFLTGLILVACESLWEVGGMVDALSETLLGYDQKQFLRRVPGLRSAFAALTPRQTDRLAEVVAATTDSGSARAANARVIGIGEADVLRHTAASSAAVDQLNADGLGSWFVAKEPER